jgi:hypothetical protein
MSVIVVARFSVPDVAKAIESFTANAALLDEITEDAKRLGGLHHRFLAGDGEIIVEDEWGTAEQFESFFAGNAKVERITTAAGVQGPPAISVYSPVDAPGTF